MPCSLRTRKGKTLRFSTKKFCYSSSLSVNFILKIQLNWWKKICGCPGDDFSRHPHFWTQEYYFFGLIHIRSLKQALNYVLVLKKMQIVIKFNQEVWLKSYIDMKTELRKKWFWKIFFRVDE